MEQTKVTKSNRVSFDEDNYEFLGGSPGDSIKSHSINGEPSTPTDTVLIHRNTQQNDIRSSHLLKSQSQHQSQTQSYYGGSTFLESSLIRNIPNIRNQKIDQEVLQSLLYEENIILQRAQDLSKIHTDLLNKGSSSRKVRRGILTCFRSLNQLYEAISELYSKEAQRKQYIISRFEQRTQQKEELIHEIEEIRDVTKGEGYRLNQLLEEKKTLDGDIEALEKRLNQLKEKRSVLKTEIEHSESIIESRASSYLETLREVEEEGRNAIKELMEEKSVIGLDTKDNKEESTVTGLFSRMRLSSTRPDIEINPEIIFTALKLQVESFEDNSVKFKQKEEDYYENYLLLANASDLLDDLEQELSLILKSSPHDSTSTEQKIVHALQRTYDMLYERVVSFKNVEDTVKQVLEIEMSSIKQGLTVLGSQATKQTEGITRSSPKTIKPSPVQNLKRSVPVVSKSPPVFNAAASSGPSSFNTPSSSLQDMLKNNLKLNQSAKQSKND